MATKTSVKSGLWSAADTWDSGIPADGDAVVIASGHVVEYDYDMSAWVTGVAGLTITGTLSLARTSGTYKLFIKASSTIAGAGTFDCGTSASPIPITAKHTITGGSGWYINGAGGLTMTVYAAEPVIKTVLLTQNEAIGATILHVDTDVTGDIWADGDTIHVDDINKSADSEERIIAAGGRAAGTITITAGLTAAKSTGAVVSLITRNVKFIGNAQEIFQYFSVTGKLTLAGGSYSSPSRGILNTTLGVTISGGVVYNSTRYTSYCNYGIISGGVFSGIGYILQNSSGVTISGGSFTGISYVFENCYGITITGGTFKGFKNAIILSSGVTIYGGSFFGATAPVYKSSVVIKNASFTGNTADINSSIVQAYNSIFGSTTENTNYSLLSKETYSESIDHGQVSGAYKAWTKGGVTSSQAVTVPIGLTQAMQTVLENAAVEGYWQKEYTVGAGASINVVMNLRKDASMTYLPRILIFNKASTDPFAGGTPLKTFMMTNSIDTWEADSYTYTNNGTADVTLVIRCQGMNATGNMYSALDIEVINVDLTAALEKLTAIQDKTDQLTFTVPNQVDANALTGGTSPEDIRIEMDTNSTKLASIKEDLDNPDQYKADVSALALASDLQEVDDKVDHIKSKMDLLDVSKVNVVTPVNGSTITILRGDTFIATLTDIGNLTNYISLDFSVKRTVHEPDDNATIRIRKNVSGTDDGLLRLNGAAHAVGTDGSITIGDTTTGDITITLKAGVTKELIPGNYTYDIQLIEADEVSTLTSGVLIVSPDVTRLVA